MFSARVNQKVFIWIAIGLILTSIGVGLIVSYSFATNNTMPADANSANEVANATDNTTYKPDLTEEQVKEILLANDEVQNFIEYFNQNVELYLDYDNTIDYWYATYISLDDYTSYLFAIVDDNTTEIIYIETFYANTDTNLTEEEVLQIALNNEEVQDFLADYTEYEYYIYYDYYQYWYVDFYSVTTYAWCSVVIDDKTSEVIEVYRMDEVFVTNLTEEEVLEIALSDPDVQQFVANNPDYEYYIYISDLYDAFTDENNDLGGMSSVWVVEFYTLDYTEWITLWIDDATGEIIEKWMSVPPNLNESDVLNIAATLPEVQDFYANYENVTVDVWYDGIGYWYLLYYSPTSLEAYVYVIIDDLTGEITYVESYTPMPPQHTEEEVLSMVLNTDEVSNFIATYSDATYYLYYIDGYWYFDIYSESANIGIFITIDDSDLVILSIEYYNVTIDA